MTQFFKSRLLYTSHRVFSFHEIARSVEADGVLRFFVAVNCAIMDCPVDMSPPNGVITEVFGIPCENCKFEECFFLSSDLNPNPPKISSTKEFKSQSEIDVEIDRLLEIRSAIK